MNDLGPAGLSRDFETGSRSLRSVRRTMHCIRITGCGSGMRCELKAPEAAACVATEGLANTADTTEERGTQ